MDEKDFSISLTCDEHSFLKDLMLHTIDTFYVVNGDNIQSNEEMRNRYKFLYLLKNKLVISWNSRFIESQY